MKKTYVAIIGLLFIPTVFGAELSFDVRETDLSLNYLRMIFGTIEGALYGQGTQLLGRIFGVLNAAVLSIAGMILLYILIVSTVNTAQSGEVMGKTWSSIWIPMRAAIGIALLLPKASGYCTIQAVLMWLIIQGIGVANSVWDTALDYLKQGGALISENANLPGGLDLAKEGTNIQKIAEMYLKSSACMLAIEKELEDKIRVDRDALNRELGYVNQYESAKANWLASGKTLPVLRQIKLPNGAVISAPMPAPSRTRNEIQQDLAALPIIPSFTSTVSFPGDALGGGRNAEDHIVYFPGDFGTGQEYYTDTYKGKCGGAKLKATSKVEANLVKMLANGALYNAMESLASSYVDDDYEKIEGANQAMALAIVNYYYAMASGKEYFLKTKSDGLDYNKAKNYGWLGAGAFYYDIVSTKRGVVKIEDAYAKVSPYPIALGKSTFQDKLIKALKNASDPPEIELEKADVKTVGSNVFDKKSQLRKYIKKYADKWNTADYYDLQPSDGNFSQADGAGWIIAASVGYGAALVAFLATVVGMIHPVAGGVMGAALAAFTGKALAGFGPLVIGSGTPIADIALMGAGMMDMAATAWVTAAGGILGGVMSSSAFAGWNPAPFAFIAVSAFVGPMVALVMTLLMVGGATLFIYVPLIPVVVYLFAAIGWFFAVVEAIAAAPLVAIGIVHPEGHEAFGKSEAAIMLALNIFLRPTMMVIAFIIASMLSHMSLWLLNKAVVFGLFQSIGSPAAIGPGVVFAIPMVIMIYGYFATWLIQTVFDIVPKLPDEFERWIGGAVTSYSTSTAQGKAQQLGSSVGGAAGQLGGAMGQGVAGGMSKVGEKKLEDSKKTQVKGDKDTDGGGAAPGVEAGNSVQPPGNKDTDSGGGAKTAGNKDTNSGGGTKPGNTGAAPAAPTGGGAPPGPTPSAPPAPPGPPPSAPPPSPPSSPRGGGGGGGRPPPTNPDS